MPLTTRPLTRAPPPSPPPPSLYDTSISSAHEETATVATAMSTAYHSGASGGYHPSSSPTLPQPRLFPKSHPPNLMTPKYDPRAYRRDELQYKHRPVRSEPIACDYPDPEPDVHRLERQTRWGGPLPVFTLVDGVASEVALGSRSGRSYHTLQLGNKGGDWRRRLDGDPSRAPPSDNSAASRKLTAREAVAAAAWHRRQREEKKQQLQQKQQRPPAQSTSIPSSRPGQHRRDNPAVSSRERHSGDEKGVSQQDGNHPAAGGNDDWQRRAEIETPRPARVCELKQRLWDSRESLIDAHPAPHPHAHPALHYDRPSLDRHWKNLADESSPSSPRYRTSAVRARSLSPRAIARSSAAVAAPSTPRPHAPPPHSKSKMFQSRFVQAAQRHLLSPSSARLSPPSHHHEQPTKQSRALGSLLTTANASRQDPPPRRKPTNSHPDRRRGTTATQTESESGPTLTNLAHPRTSKSSQTQSTRSDRGHAPAAGDSATSSSPPSLVADLVAQLQNLPRDNPHQAWAELDAILEAQSRRLADASQVEEKEPVPGTDPYEDADDEEAAAARDDRIPNLSVMATKSHPDDEATAEPPPPVMGQDDVAHRQDDDDEDDDDDDGTSVSSITNPTYEPAAASSDPTVQRPRDYLVSAKSAGQPRPSALLASSRARRTETRLSSAPAATAPLSSSQPTTQQSHRHHSRRNRDRSPPPAAIHVGSAGKDAKRLSSYQKLADEGNEEQQGDGFAPRRLESDFVATLSTGASPPPAGPQKAGSDAKGAAEPEPTHQGMEWNLLTSNRAAPGASCPCPAGADAALNTSVDVDIAHMSALVAANPVSCAATAATATTDPTTHAATELAEKIRRWDEMSEPDFCPNVCSRSQSADKDDRFTNLADGICPRTLLAQASAPRRHHPWDASIPVSMGRVEVHETSMEHAVGVETQYSMKYEDVVSEASVSVEASSGPQRYMQNIGTLNDSMEPTIKAEKKLKDRSPRKADAPTQDTEVVSQGHPKQSRGGDTFDVNPKLLASPDVVWESASRKSSERQQAYARNLADDFDSAWVSLPSSSFFPAEKGIPKKPLAGIKSDAISSKSVASNDTRSTEGQPNRYQTFQAREEHKKSSTCDVTPRRGGDNVSNGIGVVGVAKAAHTENKAVKEKTEVYLPSTSAAHPVEVRSRRGLRKFLKLRQGGRTTSTSQESVSTSSRSYLQSVSLDLEATETAPPNRGRSHLETSSPDRLRSHSLEERRMRNPSIAKKFNRLLRVYDESDERKQFGHI